METTDVVIIGGGPSGSVTAGLLAQRGIHALMLERERFPRFHIGESLLPQSMRILWKLGLREELDRRFIRKYGARFVCSSTGRRSEYRFSDAFDATHEYAHQVQRGEFDELLFNHAVALGAEGRQQWTVEEPIFSGSKVIGVRARDPEGNQHEIFAKLVIDATGRDTLMASKARVKHRIPDLDKTAIFSHYTGVERQAGLDEGSIDIVVYPHGWFWNIPFKSGVNSIGGICSAAWMKTRTPGESLGSFFDRTVATAPFVADMVRNATRTVAPRAFADFSYRVDQLAGDGWVMVGDSSGFLDPLFSTGVHLGLASAEMLVPIVEQGLREGDFSAAMFVDYERRVRAGVGLFLGAVQAFYDGAFADVIFQQPQRKVLRQTIVSMLSGDVFKDGATWARFLSQQYPARLPTADAPIAQAGASPMIEA